MHLMTNDQPCGRPDGHNGKHASRKSNHCRCGSHSGDEWWHGRLSGYQYHDCRCEFCARANSNHHSYYGSTPTGKARRCEANWRDAGIIGMTWERFEKMLAAQGNCCLVCGREFIKTPHVDHDHNITDRDNVRGLLCGNCNSKLGWVENNLNSILSYLRIERQAIGLRERRTQDFRPGDARAYGLRFAHPVHCGANSYQGTTGRRLGHRG